MARDESISWKSCESELVVGEVTDKNQFTGNDFCHFYIVFQIREGRIWLWVGVGLGLELGNWPKVAACELAFARPLANNHLNSVTG